MARTSVGLNLDDGLLEDLDELKREWDARETRTVSRSDVANEAVNIGLAVLEQLDERQPNLTSRQRRMIARQAILDHLRDEEY